MIGMNFWAFLVLSVTAVVAAALIHYGARYQFLEGFDGFLAKVIAGWVGAWLGSRLIGDWFERLKIANIYLIPALLGAFAGAFVVVATGRPWQKHTLPQ
jgi:uncharacterized membrane protein YeaQ/YmgE (transglycosylase-associated protein family)